MSLEDLEKFALWPAPRDVTIQCRITRDRRGMEKGIYPTYYLHMEKEDGKRVSSLRTENVPSGVFLLSLFLLLLGVSDGGQEKEKVQDIQLPHLHRPD